MELWPAVTKSHVSVIEGHRHTAVLCTGGLQAVPLSLTQSSAGQPASCRPPDGRRRRILQMTSAHNYVVHLCVSFRKLIAETCVLLLLVQIKLHLLYTEKFRDILTVKNPAVLRHVVKSCLFTCCHFAGTAWVSIVMLHATRTILQSNSLHHSVPPTVGDNA